MNETQFCERADTVVRGLADDGGHGALLTSGAIELADTDHIFYLSADRTPRRRAVAGHSREILGW